MFRIRRNKCSYARTNLVRGIRVITCLVCVVHHISGAVSPAYCGAELTKDEVRKLLPPDSGEWGADERRKLFDAGSRADRALLEIFLETNSYKTVAAILNIVSYSSQSCTVLVQVACAKIEQCRRGGGQLPEEVIIRCLNAIAACNGVEVSPFLRELYIGSEGAVRTVTLEIISNIGDESTYRFLKREAIRLKKALEKGVTERENHAVASLLEEVEQAARDMEVRLNVEPYEVTVSRRNFIVSSAGSALLASFLIYRIVSRKRRAAQLHGHHRDGKA